MSVSFPDFYPNECLYSVLSRDFTLHRYSNPLRSIEKNYGTSNRNAFNDLIYLPTSLNRLINNLPRWQTYNIDEIIYNHTLYKLMVFGRKSSYQRDIFSAMKSDGAATLRLMNGLKTFRQGKSHLLFCENCVQNDRYLYGETYWHREHQAPGILVCPYHGSVLKISSVGIGRYFEHDGFIDAERCLKSNLDFDNIISIKSTSEKELLLKMSHIILQMLNVGQDTSREKTGEYLKEHLLSSGLGLANSRVALNTLTMDIQDYTSIDFLDRIGFAASARARPYSWVGNLIRNCETVANPIIYALILSYLDLSVSQYLDNKRQILSTGRVFQIMNTHPGGEDIAAVSIFNSRRTIDDEATAARVPQAIAYIKMSNKQHGRFVRASFNSIAKHLGVVSQLNNRKTNYPLTIAAIKELEEGKIEFCLRRIERTFASLVENKEKMTKSILITRSGINIKDYHNGEILSLINKLINSSI